MLKLTGIKKDYISGDSIVNALKGIDVTFRKSEFVSILGQSGCGKTTLLNIIGGLDHYTEGDLIINGISTKEYKDRDWDTYRNHTIGFVFQSYNLIPHLSVLGNVEIALTISGVKKSERKNMAIAALEKVGLKDQINKRPNQLSGGQMQRVAIARAIVNNPDIILADEPTGALDTETSIQVMDILKEISKDKLVVMVTHNPELADSYSSRIVKLLDGKIVADSNPVTAEEEQLLENEVKAVKEQEEKELQATGKKKRKRKKYSSMSFFTAFSLSLKNLFTKKARMILTSIAGSIGIIGIALILSLSSGMTSYINRVQRDTLSTYPITIDSETMDYTTLLRAVMGNNSNNDKHTEDGNVYPNDVMISMFNSILSGAKTNNLREFKKYIEDNEEEFYKFVNAIKYTYDIVDLNIYDVNTKERLNPSTVFIDLVKKVMMKKYPDWSEEYTDQMIEQTGLKSAMFRMEVWSEMLDNQELLELQYDLVGTEYGSRWAKNYDEVVLVLNNNYTINDYALYSLGLVTEPTLEDIADSVVAGEDKAPIAPLDYESLLNQTFKVVLKADYFSQQGEAWVNMSSDKEYVDSLVEDSSKGITLKIVGIVKPNKNASAHSINGTIGYTSALTREIVARTNNSSAVKYQIDNPSIDIFTGESFKKDATMNDVNNFMAKLQEENQILYNILMTQWNNYTDEEKIAYYVAYENQDRLQANLKALGVVDLDNPSSISFYCKDFEAKEGISGLINKYNDMMLADEHKGESYTISYTDYVELMMSSITTIINAISYVLIAFVSISLIVSSIMIGIITYISVIERTKEIGVLRSLGASKRDVSTVFNAETLIIGLTSGVLGILVTLLLNVAVLTPIIKALAKMSGIYAVLPVAGAFVLILISVLLTLIAGLIPAYFASKKDPVIALRTE